MANNILKFLKLDIEQTIGDKLLALEIRPYAEYKEGIKGEQAGITITCLSETMNYEKVDIKIAGLLKSPIELDGSPVPVAFDGLEGKVWQDWNNKGEAKLSITAQAIRPLSTKQIKLGGDKV